MTLRDHFLMFAGYNRWANGRLYDAAAALPAEEYRRDRRGFFRSIHGTLNHLLVTDRIWLARLTGSGAAPAALDAILYPELAALRSARASEDARIIAFVEAQDETSLAGSVRYRNTKGESFEQPLSQALAHLFNHQTHHRGQAHDMLSQTGMDPPSLDLIVYLRSAGRASLR